MCAIDGMLKTLDPIRARGSRTYAQLASGRKGATTASAQHRGGDGDITVMQLFEGSRRAGASVR
jgi:hypothetical protein